MDEYEPLRTGEAKSLSGARLDESAEPLHQDWDLAAVV